MMMSYVQKPTIHDCKAVSESLHKKFRFLGGESSEVSDFHFYNEFYFGLYYRVLGNGLCIQEFIM